MNTALSESTFFDKLAASWDDMREKNENKLQEMVRLIGFRSGDRVMDVGSGTGVLLPFIHQAIGSAGQITAVDFSAGMLERARVNYRQLGRIRFVVADVMEMPVDDLYDQIVCLNFFPHVKNKPEFLTKMRRHLKLNGTLVIMHDISREKVNAIHGGSREVAEDRLPPATEVVTWLRQANYDIREVIDCEDRYFIRAWIKDK